MFDIFTTDVRSRQALWRDFLMPCWKDMADAEDDTRPYWAIQFVFLGIDAILVTNTWYILVFGLQHCGLVDAV